MKGYTLSVRRVRVGGVDMKKEDLAVGESLSAWVDGELGKEQRAFLYRRLSNDGVLRDKWARYHLIGDALRGEATIAIGDDFAGSVMAAIDGEVGITATGSRRRMGMIAGAAAALAVFAVSAVSALLMLPTQGDMAPTTAGAVAVSKAPEPENDNARLQQARVELERRLDAYLADHNALLARSGHSGMMAFVQMADYRAQSSSLEP